MTDSKEVTKMEWLPEEVVEVIAGNLTATDLASCCAVSVSWREIFGRDYLWRPHRDPDLSSYLATSQPAVQPGFLSLETHDSTLSVISPTRLDHMRERHLRNNWSCGNYKLEVTPHRFLDFYSAKISYNNDYILEFFNHKITVWDITKTPLLHSEYPFHTAPNGRIKLFEIKRSNKIVAMQCGLVRVFNLDLSTKELQLHLLFSIEMSEKCPVVNDEILHALFKKPVRVSSTFVDDILVGTVYGNDKTVLSLHVWNVDTGTKLKEEICTITINKKIVNTEFHSCNKTKNIVIIYIVHNIEEEAGIRYYQVFSLVQLKALPFLKMFSNPDNESIYNFYCAIFSHFIAIREDKKVYVYDYRTSELIYTSDTFGAILPWRNNIVLQNNNYHLSVLDVSTKHIVAQFEVEGIYPLVIADNAICVSQDLESLFAFVARKELSNITNQNKSFLPLYSVQRGRRLFINKACTKIVIGDCSKFIVVHFW